MSVRSRPGTGGPGALLDAREVHVVLPGGIDDPTLPSGGNTYDRRVCAGLRAAGLVVHAVPVPGGWPRPGQADRSRLAAVLAGVPDGATVLLDGLVGCAVPQLLAAHAGRLRLVVLVHLPLADETGLAPAVAAALDAGERAALQVAHAVVATSTAVARRLVVHHGLPGSRVRVAVPGVERAAVTPGTPGGGRLLCVASVIPRKGQDVLVRALAEVADLDWTCTVVGPLDRDRRYADRVRRRASARRLRGRVEFTGPQSDPQVARLYAASDLLVLPSRAEPYGMVITEALARGLPVLASAVDGIPEAAGRTSTGSIPGRLVPPGDPAALAEALRDWLTDPMVRHRLRVAARARRAGLSGWDATTSALADVLAEVSTLDEMTTLPGGGHD